MINEVEVALSALTARQRVVAKNLANVNTPGFTRADIDFHAYMRDVFTGGEPGEPEPQLDHLSPVRYDGNNVTLEREMFALSQTALQYEAVVRYGEEEIQRLRTAILEG